MGRPSAGVPARTHVCIVCLIFKNENRTDTKIHFCTRNRSRGMAGERPIESNENSNTDQHIPMKILIRHTDRYSKKANTYWRKFSNKDQYSPMKILIHTKENSKTFSANPCQLLLINYTGKPPPQPGIKPSYLLQCDLILHLNGSLAQVGCFPRSKLEGV